MRRSLKTAIYLLCVSVLSATGIWLCKRVIWLQTYADVDLYTNLLLGICTNALFASVGFWINYFDKKQELKKDLFINYRKIRNRCFERLFYEANSYDNDFDEVAEICDYLNQNRKIFFDYWPPLLVVKVTTRKLFNKFRFLIKKREAFSSNSDTNNYLSEDPYAVICSLYAQLSFFFTYLNGLQLSLCECDRIIEFCKTKLSQSDETDIYQSEYKVYLEEFKKFKALLKRRLESRFCYGSRYSQSLSDKKDLFAKFYAIDIYFNDIQPCNYSTYYLLPKDEYIVEDKIKPYCENN